MGFFSKRDNSPKKEAVKEAQAERYEAEVRSNTLQKLGQARMAANTICAELNAINYNKIRGQENIKSATIIKYVDGEKVSRTGIEIVNDMESYLKTISARLAKEDMTDLVITETERIDSKLVYFAQILTSALNEGDLRTAEVCELALVYGIRRGHNPIPPVLGPVERERELTEREKKIDIYKEMVSTAMEMNKLDDTKKKLSAKYSNEVVPKYNEAHEDFLKNKSANQSIYDEISGKSGEELSGEHLEAWKKTARDNNLYKTLENIVREIAGIDSNISNYELSMMNLKNALDLQAVSFNAELQMKIDRILSEIPSKMTEILATSRKTQESLDKMFNEFDATMNDPDLRVSMARAASISSKIEAKELRREQQRKNDEEAQIAKWNKEAQEAEEEVKRKQRLERAKIEALEKQAMVDKMNTQPIEKPIVKKKKQVKGMD